MDTKSPKTSLHVKKGDLVQVLTGKHAGEQARVEYVVPKKGRVVLGGLNMVKRHQKTTKNRPGGIVEKPASVDTSNVMLVCPSCNLKTRPQYHLQEGKKVRVCRKCGKHID
jgi:large subunit ribosomal protein L24